MAWGGDVAPEDDAPGVGLEVLRHMCAGSRATGGAGEIVHERDPSTGRPPRGGR